MMLLFSGCIDNDKEIEKERGNENEYAKGSIVVQFSENINFTQAMEILNHYNLTLSQSFSQGSFNPVKVPVGEEYYYMELLIKDPNIINTSLRYAY